MTRQILPAWKAVNIHALHWYFAYIKVDEYLTKGALCAIQFGKALFAACRITVVLSQLKHISTLTKKYVTYTVIITVYSNYSGL